MAILAERLDAAIRASGKTAEEIAAEADVSSDTISRLRTGKHDNPELQVLNRIARALKTSAVVLLGGSDSGISPDDERELLRHRDWINRQLASIDARSEPNALIVESGVTADVRQIADGPRRTASRIESPFGPVALKLKGIGDSMIGAGILPDDTLYATAPTFDLTQSAAGEVIACRLGNDVFVKRLVREHRKLFLVSEHPRYRAIALTAAGDPFEILGVVIGRAGRIN